MSKEILAAFNSETGTWDVVDEEDFYDMDKPEEALQKAYKKGRKDALNEVRNILHDIYSSNSYCHDTSLCDAKGFGCDDCLYADVYNAIKAMMKEGEQKNE